MSPPASPLRYQFELFTDAGLTTLVAARADLPEGAGTTEWTVPFDLDENRAYWWRVRASDAYTPGPYSAPACRFFVNSVNEAPGAPRLNTPTTGNQVAVHRPDLVIDNAIDADGFTVFLVVTAASHISAGSVSAPSISEPTVDIPSSLSVASPTVVEPDIEIPAAINIDVPTVIEPNVTIPTSFSIGTPSVTEPTVTIPSSLSVAAPTIVEPAVDIPASIAVADIWDEWETRYLELADWLVTQRIAFMTAYFPDEQSVYEAAEGRLQAAIANPNVGLPADVASQIWGDDQARILSHKNRAQDAVVAQFAASRFPLPPGAAAAAVAGIEQKSQEALAESSRKIAAMSVDLQKFNLESILKLRQVSMSSVVDYIKALASGPDIATVGAWADSQAVAIASLSMGAGWLYFTVGAYWSVTTDLSKTHAGTLSGVMNMGANVGGVISPSLTPWLADHWGRTASLLVAALIALCGGVMWMKIDASEGLRE